MYLSFEQNGEKPFDNEFVFQFLAKKMSQYLKIGYNAKVWQYTIPIKLISYSTMCSFQKIKWVGGVCLFCATLAIYLFLSGEIVRKIIITVEQKFQCKQK